MPLEQFTTNFSATVRHETLEGRQYLVAPMVMLTEGVHAGSNGALYYPANELKKTPVVWNHKPVVVYHPTHNGNALSACTPDTIEKYKVGIIMNAAFKKGKLHAEAWLEESRLKLVDNRVLEALESGTMMEVSTGLFTDNEDADDGAKWNNEAYSAIARNYKPDHLAILPDKLGACSIADGAGLLRVNSANHLTTNTKSFSDINSDLYELIREKGVAGLPAPCDAWVQDVFDKYFIFSRDGQLYQQGYNVDASDTTTLVGEPEEVVRVAEYRKVDVKAVGNAAPSPTKEVVTVTREQRINAIVGNAQSGFTEIDRPFLNGRTDDQLLKLMGAPGGAGTGGSAGTTNAGTPPVPPTPPAPTAPAAPTANAAPVAPAAPAAPAAPVTMAAWLASVPPELAGLVSNGLAAHTATMNDLITTITANANNVFTRDQLVAMGTGPAGLGTLQAMAALAKTPAPVAGNPLYPVYRANYAGAAAPAPTGAAPAVNECLMIPTMNFGPEEPAKP